MKKLIKKDFYTLTEEEQKSIIAEFGETYNPAYLTGEYSKGVVNAEVVTDEDGTLYDIRVFDPYNQVHPRKDDDGLITDQAVYIGPDGWSHWLFCYEDLDGNDVDTILENQE